MRGVFPPSFGSFSLKARTGSGDVLVSGLGDGAVINDHVGGFLGGRNAVSFPSAIFGVVLLLRRGFGGGGSRHHAC